LQAHEILHGDTVTHLNEFGEEVRVAEMVRGADREQNEGHQVAKSRGIKNDGVEPAGRLEVILKQAQTTLLKIAPSTEQDEISD